MLESQRLQKEKFNLEKALRGASEFRSDDPEYDNKLKERGALQGKLDALNERIIDALEKEDIEAQAVMQRTADTSGWTPELRELQKTASAVSVSDYVDAAVRQSDLTGAAKEYNDHVLSDWKPGDYPLEILLDREEIVDLPAHLVGDLKRETEENRASITGVGATHGMLTWGDRLFASSDGAYVGATYPVVGPGRHGYPIVTGTSVAQSYARGATETPAGGITVKDADAGRIQHSYEVASSDELQMPGIMGALEQDLRMSLQAGLDNKVITDLLTALADPDAETDVITLEDFLGKIGSTVDGVAARDIREVRMLLGVDTYAKVSGLSISGVMTFYNGVNHDQVRASSHIPAKVSDNQAIIKYRSGAMNVRRLIAPVWRRGNLLRDANSKQTSGLVVLTGVMYADVVVVNTDQHVQDTAHLA